MAFVETYDRIDRRYKPAGALATLESQSTSMTKPALAPPLDH